MAASPIADLSYRNYDGVLLPPRNRWWVIAKMTIMQALRKKSLWVFTALSGWYYLAMIFVLFFMEQSAASTPPGAPNPLNAYLSRISWKDQFLHGFGYGQLLFMLIALIIGAGAIANDNRANALLVYLSKPCDKRDYLFGKWFGVFLPLLIVSAVPSLVFYFYGAMSFREHGFLSDDPWLVIKLATMLPLGAAFHASIIIGFSSLFQQGRIAGATYAGLYFLTNFFTKLMTVAWMGMTGTSRHPGQGPEGAIALIGKLYYGSIDGVNIAMAKSVLGTDGSVPFGFPSPFKEVPAPSLFFSLSIIVGLSALAMYVAWVRIRPVEVVG